MGPLFIVLAVTLGATLRTVTSSVQPPNHGEQYGREGNHGRIDGHDETSRSLCPVRILQKKSKYILRVVNYDMKLHGLFFKLYLLHF